MRVVRTGWHSISFQLSLERSAFPREDKGVPRRDPRDQQTRPDSAAHSLFGLDVLSLERAVDRSRLPFSAVWPRMSGSRDGARRPAGGPARCGVHLLQFAAQTETRCPVVGGDGFVPVFREELAALGPAGCGRPVFTPGFAPARVDRDVKRLPPGSSGYASAYGVFGRGRASLVAALGAGAAAHFTRFV